MSLEIEAKLSCDDHAVIRERLEALGADFRSAVLETNLILDHASLDLRGRGCGLRIRGRAAVGDGGVERVEDAAGGGLSRVTVTYKGPALPGRFKSREELEFSAAELHDVASLFGKLGFVTILAYEKRRESWFFDGCLVELDHLPSIGRFVEIEGPSEGAIATVRDSLRLGGERHIQTSYVVMVLDFCRAQGIDPPALTFDE